LNVFIIKNVDTNVTQIGILVIFSIILHCLSSGRKGLKAKATAGRKRINEGEHLGRRDGRGEKIK